MKRPLIIDTDPGVDDAIALLMAAHHPDFHLLGITTVGGNVPAWVTQANARGVMALANRHNVAVYAGADHPLRRTDIRMAAHVHGDSGVQGLRLPQPISPAGQGHAVDFLIRTVRAHPEPVTIISIGPMTNLAMAIQQAPDILDNIATIVAMIGCVGDIRRLIPSPPPGDEPVQGNMSLYGEFNAYTDPDAAAIVFERAPRIIMLPLDVTHQTLSDALFRDEVRAIDPDFGANIAHMLDGTAANYPGFLGQSAPLHDPNCVVWLLNSGLYHGVSGRVVVTVDTLPGTEGTPQDLRGRTIFTPQSNANVFVAQHVDAKEYFALVVKCLAECHQKIVA